MKRALWRALVMIVSCGMAVGQAQEKVLWTFTGFPDDGSGMKSNLVSDSSGNLYGTTFYGGGSTSGSCGGFGTGCGTVFELSPQSNGSWTEMLIYDFCITNAFCPDGLRPAADVIFDKSGNLYGTASGGGSNGGGLVFELSPPSAPGNAWTETVLYNFCSVKSGNQCLDGSSPGEIVLDNLGNLYGTTSDGGSGHLGSPYYGGGTVFELSPESEGWTETVLYSFCSQGEGNSCPDGAFPTGVLFGKNGNLYGQTYEGGAGRNLGFGTVFELTPGATGWTEAVLHSFAYGNNGGYPSGNVTLDGVGNIYGAFYAGGRTDAGGIYRLGAKTGFQVVSPPATGLNPRSGVLLDIASKVLYGTTFDGGTNNVYSGAVFSVGSDGKPSTVYSFCADTNCSDGQNPTASLIQDHAGNLYGTTEGGGAIGSYCGAEGCGVVFEITP